jgi:ABC-2 type transport system permease protein
MLASMRAELLILRKWPAVWVLLLVTPLAAITFSYVFELITYFTLNPVLYPNLGTPAQDLPSMLPSQFIIAATQQFGTSSTAAPFAVVGAVIAGGDWTRGTIRTSLLQGPGRLRTLAGQVLALVVALVAIVAATFILCAAASLIIGKVEASSVVPPEGALPGIGMILRGAGADLLIACAFASFGLALGTIFRSAAGAIAATLLWTVLIQDTLYNIATQAGGIYLKIGNFLPGSSMDAVTFVFYKATGSAIYLPVSPTRGAWTLVVYTVVFLAITAVLVHRRDIAARRQRARGTPTPAPEANPTASSRAAGQAAGGWLAGLGASLRAELLVMRKRPAIWMLVAFLPLSMLIAFYLTGYVYYRTAAHGLTIGVNAQQVLSALSPRQFLTAPLSMLGIFSTAYGAVIFALLGALVAGSDWARGTIRTALLQGPSRLQARIGQDLAVLIATAASVLAAFAVAAVASAVVGAAHAGALAPGDGRYPDFPQVAGGIGGALLLCLTYAAIGLTLGTLLRSDTAAIGVAVLWTVIVAYDLDDNYAWHGTLLDLYKLLPDASANTVSNLYNGIYSSVPGTVIQAPYGIQVLPATAVLTLGLYLIAGLVIPAVITRRRDIA